MDAIPMKFLCLHKSDQEILIQLWISLKIAYQVEYRNRARNLIHIDKSSTIFANAVLRSISLSRRVPPIVAPDRTFFTVEFKGNLYNYILNGYLEFFSQVSLTKSRVFASEAVEIFDLIFEKEMLENFEIETTKDQGHLLLKRQFLRKYVSFSSENRWVSKIYYTGGEGRTAVCLEFLVLE